MKIRDLIPGMQFESILPDNPGVITYITQSQHPYFTTFQLVVWVMPKGEVMFDALDLEQELPTQPLPGSPEMWRENLGRVLKLTGQSRRL